jgi:hypothetical protein
MIVEEFLAAESRSPFRWGETDCASMVDRWIALRTGSSPLDAFGRRHSNEADAQEWLAEPGGLLRAFRQAMCAVSARETKDPVEGDVGLAIRGRKLCSAIHAGSHWVSRDAEGFMAMPHNSFLRAWSLCPQPYPVFSCLV